MAEQQSSKAPYGVVYLIRNVVNGKIYVGQTVKPLPQYIKTNLLTAATGSNKKPLLYRAFRKYGAASFEVQELCQAFSKEELSSLEKQWILDYRSNVSGIGYNLTTGGTGGTMVGEAYEKLCRPKTIEHRRKLSEARKRIGTAHLNSPEARRKKGDTLRGRVFSEPTKQKMSASAKIRKRTPEERSNQSARMSGTGNHMYGVPMPVGHQDKLQKASREWRESAPREQLMAIHAAASRARWGGPDAELKRAAVRAAMSGANNPHFGKPLGEVQKQKMIEGARRRLEALGPEGRSELARRAANSKPKNFCTICGARHKARGFCDKHYQRWEKYGDPNFAQIVTRQNCSMCESPAIAKGVCGKHYAQAKRGKLPVVDPGKSATRQDVVNEAAEGRT